MPSGFRAAPEARPATEAAPRDSNGFMRIRTLSGLTLAGVAFCALAGCEQSARQAARARPPETPVVEQSPTQHAPLPVNRRKFAPPMLTPAPPPAVEQILARAQAAFRSGEQNYKAGHLEKARRDFDRALDTLLASGLPLDFDRRLEQLFETLVEAIHAYERAAFREGDGFSEPRGPSTEAAPIDEIAEMTFPVDPRLKESVSRTIAIVPHDLPLMVTDEVVSYLNFFQTTRGRAIVESGLRRAGRYREMIARILHEEGVPQDLIYLAQAESGFKPQALSRARALGMWQFIASRGREYGLRRTWWVDERQDPEKSTRAAARHLRDLYNQFGDWYLAMAAYNTGPGNVQRAIERTGYADFWELYRRNVLPRETRNYVPIILALTIIAKDAERFSLNVEFEPPLRTERVRLGHPIDLRLVAETIDVSVDELRAMNPSLLRAVTPPDPEFELHVPEGTAQRFFEEISAIPPEKWVAWRRHRVEPGETLSGIARKYRVTAAAIADANNLESAAEIRAGDKLVIPASASAADSGRGKLVRYRVRRGDTLSLLAEQFDVSAADIKRWNGLRTDTLARGAVLKLYPGGQPAPAARKPATQVASRSQPAARPQATVDANGAITHRVQRGETLWSIARAYRTTVEALKAANRKLSNRPLQIGETLLIFPAR
jgi:membrane-bound lytic murein transglycosylase D